METDMTREEAIKELRCFIGQLTEGCQEAIKVLIPELRENGDERIRKWIAGYIHRGVFNEEEHQKALRAIEWLEKQKTSEEAIRYVKENHSPDEVSDFQAAMNIAVAKAYDKGVKDTLEKQKSVEYIDKNKVYTIMIELTILSYSQLIPINSNEFKRIQDITSEVRSLLDYPIDQKPEWSEEDEEMATRICANLEYLVKEAGSDSELKEKLEKRIKWMKRIKSLRPQTKAVWSEEDEQWLESIIKDYEDSLVKDKDHAAVIKVKIDFLKSLRPQPHWKPSEEQMEALQCAIAFMEIRKASDYDLSPLKKLYEQLKKL